MLNLSPVGVLLFWVGCCLCTPVRADVPTPFRFAVKASQEVYEAHAPVVLTISVTNTDSARAWPLLWTDNPALHDNRLLGVSIYREIGTEGHYVSPSAFTRTDEGSRGGLRVCLLAPLQTLSVTLCIGPGTGDAWNMALWPGHYRFRVYYRPFGLAPPHVYHFVVSERDSLSAERPNFLKDGVWGAACDVSVRAPRGRPHSLAACPVHCRFCRQVEQGRWKPVERRIHTWVRQTNRITHFGNPSLYGLDEHRLLWARLREHRRVRFPDGAMSDLFRRETGKQVDVPLVFVSHGERLPFRLRVGLYPWRTLGSRLLKIFRRSSLRMAHNPMRKKCPGIRLEGLEKQSP